MRDWFTCSDCGKTTTEKGSCKECLPYNLCANSDVMALVTFDQLRKIVMANIETLRQVDFHEAQRIIDTGSRKLVAIRVFLPTRRIIYLIPSIDTAGYESVWFVLDRNVRDGMHRATLN